MNAQVRRSVAALEAENARLRADAERQRAQVRDVLKIMMAWYSEQYHAASWLHQLESTLRTAQNEDAALIRSLALEAGGWWEWSESEGEPVFVEAR